MSENEKTNCEDPFALKITPPVEMFRIDVDGQLWNSNFLFSQHNLKLPLRSLFFTKCESTLIHSLHINSFIVHKQAKKNKKNHSQYLR